MNEPDRGTFVEKTPSKPENLSARERQIAEAYSAGQSYRQIAEQLFIAPATVRTHLGTIYRKLGVSTKIELLRTLEHSDTAPDADAVIGRSPSDCAGEAIPSESELARLAGILKGKSRPGTSLTRPTHDNGYSSSAPQ